MNARPSTFAPVLLLALQGTAFAQQATPGFALDRFNPAERGSEWFVLDSLDLRGHGRPALGIVGEWAHDPLVIYNADGSVAAKPVTNQFGLHLGATVVLWDRLRLGANLPLYLAQGGAATTFGSFQVGSPGPAGIGDLRLGGDVRLAGVYGGPFTLALGTQVFLPSGSRSSYDGDGGVRVLPRLSAAGDVGPFVYAATFGVQARTQSDAFAGLATGSELVGGVSAGLRLAAQKLVLGPEVYGITAFTNVSSVFARATSPVEGLLGAHYSAGDVRFGAGVGTGFSRGLGSPAARVVASFEWAPAIPEAPERDRDHDGILNENDACPDVPGIATSDPKTNGCPDRDKDGIVDSLDACPDVPGIATSDPKTNGCPDKDKDGIPDVADACPFVPGIATDDPLTNGCPDRDKDGIVDSLDACPELPGTKTNDPKTNGCPDRDHDGVFDPVDACPDVPGIVTGDPKTNGCPDTDHDGILDPLDACPCDPGPPNKDPRLNGCPKAWFDGDQIRISDQVKFRVDSSQILNGVESDEVLFAVKAVLGLHPELKKIRIEGHTDSDGSKKHNQILSSNRAVSVKRWLVAHGIESGRLTTIGYGQDKPIADNSLAEGKHANRRVEFHAADQPPGAAPARPGPAVQCLLGSQPK